MRHDISRLPHSGWSRLASQLTIVLIALAVSPTVHAQALPRTRVGSIQPPAVQAGQAAKITLNGVADLDEPVSLWCSAPGWSAVAEPAPLARPIDSRQFTVSVPATTPPGWYEMALVGRYGATVMRRFRIEAVPVRQEQEPNDVTEQRNALELDSPTYGVIDRAADVDRYSIQVTDTDRTLLVACDAEPFGSALQPLLELFDSRGKRVATAGKAFQGRTLLAIGEQPPGDYTLSVTDFALQGDAHAVYRLTVTTDPVVISAWPPVAASGQRQRFELFGHNLGGAKLSDVSLLERVTADVAVPEEAAAVPSLCFSAPETWNLRRFDYTFSAAHPETTTVPIFLSQSPVQQVEEKARNIDQAVNVPLDILGHFDSKGDRDQYTFTARKGDSFDVEIMAMRYGSPVDPVVLVEQLHDEKGNSAVREIALADESRNAVASENFSLSHDDPSLRFVAPVDGPYRITVLDRLKAADPARRRFYRLTVKRPRPEFALLALPPVASAAKLSPSATTLAIPRSGSALLQVWVDRRNGFDQPIRLSVQGLPEGVHAEPLSVPPQQRIATFRLEADRNCPIGLSQLVVTGEAIASADAESSNELRQTAAVATYVEVRPGRLQPRLASHLLISVLADPVPFNVHGQFREERHAPGSQPVIALRIDRAEPFAKEINVALASEQAEGIAVQSKTVAPTQSTALLPISIDKDAPAGLTTLLLAGSVKTQISRFPGWVERSSDLAQSLSAELQTVKDQLSGVKLASASSEHGDPADTSASVQTAAVQEPKSAQVIAVAVEESVGDTPEGRKSLEHRKQELERRLGDTQKVLAEAKLVSAPTNVDIAVPAPPFILTVVNVPYTIRRTSAATMKLSPVGEAVVTVEIDRKGDLQFPVRLSLEPLQPVAGLTAKSTEIASSDGHGSLTLHAADVPAGTYPVIVRATVLSEEPVFFDMPITIQIAP